jgi:hypothetical protein
LAKYFKVQLTDVTFTNNDDASNFLEGTEVTEISFIKARGIFLRFALSPVL